MASVAMRFITDEIVRGIYCYIQSGVFSVSKIFIGRLYIQFKHINNWTIN